MEFWEFVATEKYWEINRKQVPFEAYWMGKERNFPGLVVADAIAHATAKHVRNYRIAGKEGSYIGIDKIFDSVSKKYKYYFEWDTIQQH